MRQPADASRIQAVLEHLGRATRSSLRVYLTGGATAVLHGWRSTTVDVDLKLVPDSDEVLRAMPRLKEELEVNVELAVPEQFIPPLPGWEERSLFIRQVGTNEKTDPYPKNTLAFLRQHYGLRDKGCAEQRR